MFSYIYADGHVSHRGLTQYLTANTEQAINKLALDHISNMIADHMPPNEAENNELHKKVIDAVTGKNAADAIKAWDKFATSTLKTTIARHGIQQITFIE